jgi:PAS domain S-box-containing protein
MSDESMKQAFPSPGGGARSPKPNRHLADTMIIDVLWMNAIIGLAILDMDGYFVEANPHLCEMLSYAPSELVGKNIRDITHPSDINDDVEMLNRLVRGDTDSYIMTKRFISKGERVVWVKMRVNKYTLPDGRCLRYLSQIAKEEDFGSPPQFIDPFDNTHKSKRAVINTSGHPVLAFWHWCVSNWKSITIFATIVTSIVAAGFKFYNQSIQTQARVDRIEELLTRLERSNLDGDN